MGSLTSCPISLLICQSIKMEHSSDEDVVFIKEEYIFHCDMNLVDLTLTSDGYLDQKQKGSPSSRKSCKVEDVRDTYMSDSNDSSASSDISGKYCYFHFLFSLLKAEITRKFSDKCKISLDLFSQVF